jgi:hypothetical protein
VRAAALLFLILPIAAWARPKPKPSPKSAPAAAAAKPAAPAPSTPEPPKSAAPKPGREYAGVATPELLQRAQQLYTQLEYDQVIPVTEELLTRSDLQLEQKLEAHRLNGCAKAIVQDPADAEKPFRLLLRGRPSYDLPADTPPKILAVFRKVQIEERALAEQAEAFQRESVIKTMKVLDVPPADAKGGRPLPFSLRLRDPGGVVESVKVPYRRAGQGEFSVLALQRDDEGRWRGQIPADFTADPQGFTLEYYVETADPKGPLVVEGSAKTPLKVEVAAGKLQGPPPPLHRAIFATGVALTALAGLTWGGLAIWELQTQSTYSKLSGTQYGASVTAMQRLGDTLATGANAAAISAGVLALITVTLAFFTDWDPQPK